MNLDPKKMRDALFVRIIPTNEDMRKKCMNAQADAYK